MKKIRNFVLLCLVAIMATGCIKFNATMDIRKDKSMDFVVIYAIDKSIMGEGNSIEEGHFDQLKDQGFKVEKYNEGNFEGFKLTKKINNIDEVSTSDDVIYNLSGMVDETEGNKYMFKVVKDGEKSTYYAKLKFDSNDSTLTTETIDDEEEKPDEETLTTGTDEELTVTSGNEDATMTEENKTTEEKLTTSLDDMDLSGLMSGLDLSFSVNLPSSAISSNATTKSDNDTKLSWKLGYSGSQTIEFAFTIDPNASDSNILLYVGIGVGVLVLLAVIILLIRKGGKKDVVPVNDASIKINNDVNDAIVTAPEVHEETNVMEEEK